MVRPLQQRSKISDVPDRLHMQHAFDQRRVDCAVPHGRHQVVTLGDQLLARHRIVDGAQHSARVLSHTSTVVQCDLQKGQPSATASAHRRFKSHFRAQAQDRRLFSFLACHEWT